MTAKLDNITAIVTKIFDLITLGMNKFIQFRSQMGTIKGYVKGDEPEKEPTPAIETLPDEDKLIHEPPEVDFTTEEKTE